MLGHKDGKAEINITVDADLDRAIDEQYGDFCDKYVGAGGYVSRERFILIVLNAGLRAISRAGG